MPHSAHEKQRALTRLHRIKGQVEGLERAVVSGVECRALLQQIAALRGAANGLMADVLDGHLRETFEADATPAREGDIDEIMAILRTYLK